MRYWEIISQPTTGLEIETAIDEETANGGVAPLTPAQSRAKAKRMTKAVQGVQDVKAANAVRVQKAARKLFQP